MMGGKLSFVWFVACLGSREGRGGKTLVFFFFLRGGRF